jgi:hypothetical protein
MRSSKTRAVALSLSALAVGCGGPTVGDIVAQDVTLAIAGTASAPDVAALGDAQGGLGVSRAFVSASALSLIPCAEGAADIVLDPRGYDLLLTPPPSEDVSTAVSEFCGLRLDVEPVTENATDGIPKGVSLYVEGQDAAGTAFTLSSESAASLLFEPKSGSSFGTEPLLLGFDLSIWLAGLPLPEDMADMSAALFDSQLLDSAALYIDSNANQALDADEQTPIAHAKPAR